jgi:hypothetical protein
MSLKAGETRSYSLRGTPSVALNFKLEVAAPRPFEGEDANALAPMGTPVSVTIADASGKAVASASGPLRDWVLTRSGPYAAFWHRELVGLRLREGAAYTLTVSAGGESEVPPVEITPTLEGGGNELP